MPLTICPSSVLQKGPLGFGTSDLQKSSRKHHVLLLDAAEGASFLLETRNLRKSQTYHTCWPPRKPGKSNTLHWRPQRNASSILAEHSCDWSGLPPSMLDRLIEQQL